MTIGGLAKKYWKKLDALDLEIIIAHGLKKSREFVLAHPEHELAENQELKIKTLLARRVKGEPLAYILGQKEFFGLDFEVNRHTLIPRPETELLVEEALRELKTKNQKLKTAVIDVGTGSGNIIIALTKNSKGKNSFYATDISAEALKVARQNAKRHKVDKKIKFIRSDSLKYFTAHRSLLADNCVIIANLPYLSKEIYAAAPLTVKKYEPRSALYSANAGLAHYEKLFKQIKKLLLTAHCSLIVEISPEQKPKIARLVKKYFPQAKLAFHKDLAGKWRVCKFKL